MPSILKLNIADLNLSLQMRSVDEETVANYADKLANGVELPPVDVAFDPEQELPYCLKDGFHRIEAHKKNGATTILAIVAEQNWNDACWDALGANSKHGRPPTPSERKNLVEIALQHFPQYSSRHVAKHVGCSHTTVLKIRQSLIDKGLLDDEEEKESSCKKFPTEPGQEESSCKKFPIEPGQEESSCNNVPTEPGQKSKTVIGTDGKSYPVKKTQPKPMKSFSELADSLPYSYDEQQAAKAIENAIFALPSSLTLRIHEGRMIIASTDPDKPTLRDFPVQRGKNWEKWPCRPFFKFTSADWELLERNGINTIDDLGMLVFADPNKRKSIPNFGKKKIENVKDQFEEFWTAHPELCE